MALIKTKGIVLHHIKYSETSVIIKVYTERLGLQSFIIKGLRNKKSKIKRNIISQLTNVELIVNYKVNRQIQYANDIQRGYLFQSIGFDNIKNTVALFISEIILKSIREEEPNHKLYLFLEKSIEILDKSEKGIKNFPLLFLMEFSRLLGFYPKNTEQKTSLFFDLREGVFTSIIPNHNDYLDGDLQKSFCSIQNTELANIGKVEINLQMRRTLIEKLILFYNIHLPGMGVINSHKILHEVLQV